MKGLQTQAYLVLEIWNKILISNTKCARSPFNFEVMQKTVESKIVQFSEYYSFPGFIFFLDINFFSVITNFCEHKAGVTCARAEFFSLFVILNSSPESSDKVIYR